MRFAIPIVVLLVLIGFLAIGLKHDPREIPSPLIGKPMPAFALTSLDGSKPVTQAELQGRPLLVNFFASWCAGCQVEHPVLMKLSREYKVEIVGLDYKDTQADAEQWLQRHGNPYRSVIADPAGQAGLDWGVYGVPETYVIGADGNVLYKHIGPVTEDAWRSRIAPLLQSTGSGS